MNFKFIVTAIAIFGVAWLIVMAAVIKAAYQCLFGSLC